MVPPPPASRTSPALGILATPPLPACLRLPAVPVAASAHPVHPRCRLLVPLHVCRLRCTADVLQAAAQRLLELQQGGTSPGAETDSSGGPGGASSAKAPAGAPPPTGAVGLGRGGSGTPGRFRSVVEAVSEALDELDSIAKQAAGSGTAAAAAGGPGGDGSGASGNSTPSPPMAAAGGLGFLDPWARRYGPARGAGEASAAADDPSFDSGAAEALQVRRWGVRVRGETEWGGEVLRIG